MFLMYARTLFIALVIVVLSNPTSAQYSLNTPTEIALLGTGGALSSAGFLYMRDFPAPAEDRIKELYSTPANFAFGFDRWATRQSSRSAKRFSDILLSTSLLPPLILTFNRPATNDDRSTHAVMFLETFAMTWGLTNITKRVARRPRPFMYNNDLLAFPMQMRRSNHTRQSFFSGHTSMTTAMYFFTAQTFSQYYPNSDWKPWVWGASISIPAITGFLRVKAGKHFPTDVLIGYAVGALVGGVLVPALH